MSHHLKWFGISSCFHLINSILLPLCSHFTELEFWIVEGSFGIIIVLETSLKFISGSEVFITGSILVEEPNQRTFLTFPEGISGSDSPN